MRKVVRRDPRGDEHVDVISLGERMLSGVGSEQGRGVDIVDHDQGRWTGLEGGLYLGQGDFRVSADSSSPSTTPFGSASAIMPAARSERLPA